MPECTLQIKELVGRYPHLVGRYEGGTRLDEYIDYAWADSHEEWATDGVGNYVGYTDTFTREDWDMALSDTLQSLSDDLVGRVFGMVKAVTVQEDDHGFTDVRYWDSTADAKVYFDSVRDAIHTLELESS